MEPNVASPLNRPPIVLRTTDAERLSMLAAQTETRSPVVASLLLEEIDRAEIRPDDQVPPTYVGMHSIVDFLDEARGATRTVQLVYPREADIASNRISVLTPIGAGLIGLAAGQAINWPDREGKERLLRIVRVSPPPAEE